MRRRAKPAKSKVRSLKNEGSKVRDLVKRLAEALEQQTATSEILRVIAGSPTTLDPVLEAVVETAARLCGADNASLYRVEGMGSRCSPLAAERGRSARYSRGRGSG